MKIIEKYIKLNIVIFLITLLFFFLGNWSFAEAAWCKDHQFGCCELKSCGTGDDCSKPACHQDDCQGNTVEVGPGTPGAYSGNCGGCEWKCCGCCWPSCGGGNCFIPETEVETSEGRKKIKNLKVGQEVISFDPETGSEASSLVEKIYEVTRSAYYKVRLKDGTELKVTGEHPLYAIQKKAEPLSFWQYLKTESLLKKGFDFFYGQIDKFQI